MKEFAYCSGCGQRFEVIEGANHRGFCPECRPPAAPAKAPAQQKAPGTKTNLQAARPGTRSSLPAAGRPKTRTNLPTAKPGSRTNIPAAGRPGTRTNIPAAGRPKTRTNLPTAKPGSRTNIPASGRPGSRTKIPAATGSRTTIPAATRQPTRTFPEQKSRSPMPYIVMGAVGLLLIGIVIMVLTSDDAPPPRPPEAPAAPSATAPSPPVPAAAPQAPPASSQPASAAKPDAPKPPAPPAPPPSKPDSKKKPDKVAEEAIARARAFVAANPDDVAGQLKAWDEAVRLSALTPHFDTARRAREEVMKRGRGELDKHLAVLDDQAKPALDREEFQTAIAVYDNAKKEYSHPDWGFMIGKKLSDIRASADKLYERVKSEASAAKASGNSGEVGRLADRIARWGFPDLSDRLRKDLARIAAGRPVAAKPKTPAPAKPKPKPKPKPATPKPAAPKPAAPKPAAPPPGVTALLVDGLAGSGTFMKKEQAGVGMCWSVGTDYGKGAENHVKFTFEASEGATYRCWAYIGACCEETFNVSCQATGMERENPEKKGEQVKAVPGSTALLPIPIKVRGLKEEHVDHGGPKKPSKWVWIEVPLAVETKPGPNEVRLISLQKGFSVAAVYVSSTAEAPPATLEEVRKQAGAPGK